MAERGVSILLLTISGSMLYVIWLMVTEYDIIQMFMEMFRGKTAVIILHRVGLCTLNDKAV